MGEPDVARLEGTGWGPGSAGLAATFPMQMYLFPQGTAPVQPGGVRWLLQAMVDLQEPNRCAAPAPAAGR